MICIVHIITKGPSTPAQEGVLVDNPSSPIRSDLIWLSQLGNGAVAATT